MKWRLDRVYSGSGEPGARAPATNHQELNMKIKKCSKLTLSRETSRTLEEFRLDAAQGGAAGPETRQAPPFLYTSITCTGLRGTGCPCRGTRQF